MGFKTTLKCYEARYGLADLVGLNPAKRALQPHLLLHCVILRSFPRCFSTVVTLTSYHGDHVALIVLDFLAACSFSLAKPWTGPETGCHTSGRLVNVSAARNIQSPANENN